MSEILGNLLGSRINGGIAYEAFDDFNKTYFETYDKAEQALKEMRRDDLLTK